MNTYARVSPCLYKRHYDDWPAAERAALELMDDVRDGLLRVLKGGTVFAYPCGDHYHIGHQPLWKGSNYPTPASSTASGAPGGR